jgi:hypothetical protein
MLETEDAATIWEAYDPTITDWRKYVPNDGRLWTWPTSLCHGWGAGVVPVAAEFLLGIAPVTPGFGTVSLDPCREIPWSFEATVPTPHGTIRVEREKECGAIHYTIPRATRLTPETQARIAGNVFSVSYS